MHITGLAGVNTNYTYEWPVDTETYDYVIEYRALADDGKHSIKIGFGQRFTYGKERARVIVWIDEHPHAEFVGADDFNESGDILSEIKIPGEVGEPICRYPDEAIPDRYAMFNTVGMPIRIIGKGVRNAWAVVANISDHRTMISLAALRRLERNR